MKGRLGAVLILLIVLPVAALAVLGMRLVATERQQSEARTRDLLLGQLAQYDTRIQEVLGARAKNLERVVTTTDDVEAVFSSLDATGAVGNAFLILADQQLVFPTAASLEGRDPGAFNRHVTNLWRNRDPAFIPVGEHVTKAVNLGKSATAEPRRPGVSDDARGWHTWYDEQGLRFLFWWRQAKGDIVGVELDQVRLMADVIAALPDTPGGVLETSRSTAPLSRFVLVDARGQDVYQWGAYEPPVGALPAASLTLSAPFRAWRIDAQLAPGPGGGGLVFSMVLGLGALLLAFAGLGLYFYRESTRALRDAAQRITFANQVSHELKTPLTNIRMYAELLEEDIAPEGRARERLQVIVSESQRLSRLIGNILTFSRKQRHKLRLRLEPGNVGETVADVLAHARPALKRRGIETHTTPSREEGIVLFDRDVVEQVINNLVSNVEKYAAEGGYLGVAWSHADGTTCIRAEDHGPGVPEGEEERIFQPFYRVSNRLTDGVAGTGIGLALARDLCRLHGGDLTVSRGENGGLCFEATFDTPPAKE